MKLQELFEQHEAQAILSCLLPPDGKPDGRKIFVKTLVSPGGVPLTSPDGRIVCQVQPRGLLVHQHGTLVFIPNDAIMEIRAEDIPEDDVI